MNCFCIFLFTIKFSNMGNHSTLVTKSDEGLNMNHPIFIQGLLGSIQTNRISLDHDVNESLEKVDREENSCFLNSFFKNKSKTFNSRIFYIPDVDFNF